MPGHPYEQGFDLKIHGDARLEQPLLWKQPRMIFLSSMSDLYHEDVPDSFIGRVFDVMRQPNWRTFQLLTKRSDRLSALAP